MEEQIGEVLDDMESRPGSTTSRLRTVLAIYLRDLGGWISVAHLLVLLKALGITDAQARTAIARVKRKGLLVSESRKGSAGYQLAKEAIPMLARGDRRVYHPRNMAPDDRWYLVSFSIPEERRHQRHQLRRRLEWIGCGMVSPALWIAPEFLADEVEEILVKVGVREECTTFVAERPLVAGDLRDALASWWDLDEIRRHHDRFLELHASDGARPPSEDVSPREAFSVYMRAIDTWRIVPYIDPGLHPSLLPEGWPGEATSELLHTIRRRYSGGAAEFVEETTGRALGREGSPSHGERAAQR